MPKRGTTVAGLCLVAVQSCTLENHRPVAGLQVRGPHDIAPGATGRRTTALAAIARTRPPPLSLSDGRSFDFLAATEFIDDIELGTDLILRALSRKPIEVGLEL